MAAQKLFKFLELDMVVNVLCIKLLNYICKLHMGDSTDLDDVI